MPFVFGDLRNPTNNPNNPDPNLQIISPNTTKPDEYTEEQWLNHVKAFESMNFNNLGNNPDNPKTKEECIKFFNRGESITNNKDDIKSRWL